MADEPVVVSKTEPMKASNGVEGKTRLTFANECKGASHSQKRGELRRGEVHFKSVMSGCFFFSGTQTDLILGYSEPVTLGIRHWDEKLYMGVALTHFSKLPLC